MASIFRVLILSALLICSTYATVFLSIDCGASDISTDDNGIKWVPDNDYINSGESKSVSSSFSNSQVMDTLRVFTTGTKNCYSIKVDKGEKVLVRASFQYGNYDNQFLGPSFDLVLNGKLWATVPNGLASSSYTYYEAIMVVEGGDISVCLVQTTAGQYPFISALEVRSLGANMYSHVESNRNLYLMSRFSGSSTTSFRYPDDSYDRIWETIVSPGTISNSNLNIVGKVEDNPPASVLQNAITTLTTLSPLQITVFSFSGTVEVPVYMNMYFAELEELDSTDSRTFDVFIGDKRLTSIPITPPYGSVLERTFTNIRASSATVFYLTATPDSTMPPIINAFELFIYSSNINYDYGSNNNNDDSGTGSGTGNGTGTDPGSNYSQKSTKASRKKKKNNTSTILGATIPSSLIILVVVAVLLRVKQNKKIAIAVAQGGQDVTANGTPNIT